MITTWKIETIPSASCNVMTQVFCIVNCYRKQIQGDFVIQRTDRAGFITPPYEVYMDFNHMEYVELLGAKISFMFPLNSELVICYPTRCRYCA